MTPIQESVQRGVARVSVVESGAESRGVPRVTSHHSTASQDHSTAQHSQYRGELAGAARLLACFEQLAGRQPSAIDQQTAVEFASSPIGVDVIVKAMRHRAASQGEGWRPSTLRYFRGVLADLERKQQATDSKPAPRPIGWCATCKNGGLLADRTHPYFAEYSKCPDCDFFADPPMQGAT